MYGNAKKYQFRKVLIEAKRRQHGRMSTALSQRVGSRPITPAGFALTLDSFSPSTCSWSPTRLLASHLSSSFTPSPATPANGSVARLAPRFTPTQNSHLSRVPLPPTCNPHRPASAANASGFLLTVLSKARHSIIATTTQSRMRASDKTLASSGR
jgi:hypothetical protein